jgi:hypothetical protein
MTLVYAVGQGITKSVITDFKKGKQMNTTLKYLSVLGIVMALVLVFGLTASRTVGIRHFRAITVDVHESFRGVENPDNDIASKPKTFCCGGWGVISPIPSCYENTVCPLDAVNSE